MNYVYEFQDP